MIGRREARRREAAGLTPGRQRGQATVELALLLPFVALVLVSVVQIGLVVRTRVMVTHAAREAARVVAVGGTNAEAEGAAVVGGNLSPARLHVTVRRSEGVAAVTVVYDAPTHVPIVGPLLDDVTMSATATMRLEDG